MSLLAFLSAVLALLLAPGPSNTLIGVAAAQGGTLRALRLIPAELAGYLLAVLALAAVGQRLGQDWPQAALALQGAAAVWVMLLAWRLWRRPLAGADAPLVGFATLLGTTLLNPKALIFALVLLPPLQSADFLPRLGLFSLAIMLAASLWALAGGLLRGPALPCLHRLQKVQRLASVWLAVVSIGLLIGLVQG